ncbi:DUF3168 domain-containing protein [Paracoccus methylarcula]|uniref:DUF3168 domain-containing protein n=1 Tax=Paracoccus methylarcula TaxID=72022 RepID=A0A3R7LMZ8_9RHOB|nr:DUF3168 domain-containing protein [Paracoccus methylarcula]RNF32949.1 DUF3168 domain-containing protein [Paracoccus methylarcula]
MGSPSLELQGAIVAALKADFAVMALISDVYDRVERDTDTGKPISSVWGSELGYISFGPEDTIADDGGCVELQDISIQLDVWSRRPGRVHCKEILHEVRRVIRSLATTENPIVARADPFEQIRQDPDGLTMHGILRYEFGVENHG